MKQYGKQAMCLLLTMVLLLTMLPVAAMAEGPIASGTCGTNLSWVITESGTLLISGSGAIPNYGTRTGAPWSNYYDSILSVDVGSGVTGIGDWAFASCNRLTTATLADTIKRIGMRTFSGCQKLKDVNIPVGVTEIGAYAFYDCRALTSVVIPEGVTTIHPATFNTCLSLTSVTLPGSLREILGQGTYGGKQVKLGAFAYCSNLTAITIPDGVTEIGYMAFHSCQKLTSIAIPASVKSIGDMAFGYDTCAINFLGSAPTMGSTCFDNAIIEAYYPCGNTTWQENTANDFGGTVTWNVSHTMGESATSQAATCTRDALVTGTCLNCGKTETSTLFGTALGHNYVNDVCTRCADTKLVISKQVGNLTYRLDTFGTVTISGTGPMEDEVFMEGGGHSTIWWWNDLETQITRVVIEEGVTRIGSMAFYHCRNLKSVSIPDSVTSIGTRAFAECTNLSYVIIPASVTKMESAAFYNCTNLTAVAFLGAAPTINQTAFKKTTITAYHPCDDETWTDDVRQNYGGTITWVGHLYRDYALHQAATCTENAVVTGTCGTCGTMGQTSIPDTALPHNLDQNGLCKTCGETLDISVTIKRPAFSDGIVYIDIYADGSLVKTVELGDLDDAATGSVPYIPGKTYTFQWRKSSYASSNCDFEIKAGGEVLLNVENVNYSSGTEVYTLKDLHFHQYEAVITAPDCRNTGSVTHTCTACGYSCSITVPTVGHHYEDGLCTGCGKREIPAGGSCGTSVSWYLDTMGNLTISGTGVMKDYGVGEDGTTPNAPWYPYRSLINQVVVATGVTTIGEYAFHGCQELRAVTISETVTTIGKLAFYNCTGLTDVTIPKGVTTIGSAAFRRCSGLENVILSEGITTIGKIAFFDCTGLQSLTIPGSVTTVGEYAFGNCTGLTDITFHGTAPAIDSTGFKMVTAQVSYPCNDSTWTADTLQSYGGQLTWELTHHYVEGQCTVCGKLENGCGDMVSWTLDDSGTLTISGTGPMYDFDSETLPPWTEQRNEIQKVLIGEGVTAIGSYAFQNCYILSSVTIPGTVTQLGIGAFQNCPTLNTLFFRGEAPIFHEDCFRDVKAIGYYPCDDPTWTDSGKPDTITWKAQHSFVDGVCTVCDQTIPILDSGRCGYSLTWQLDDAGTLTITGTGTMYNYEYHYDEDDPLGDMMLDIPGWNGYKTSIKAIKICDGVTSIGEDAFLYCEAVETITIGKSVTKIAALAFDSSVLKMVIMEGNAPTTKSNSFYGLTSATTLSYYEDCVGYDTDIWTKFKHTTRHPGTVVVTVPATCTMAGTREIQCTYCEKTIAEIYSTGHQYMSGLCMVCGKVELQASGSWWRLYKNGTLFIDRQGAMPDYTNTANVPWYNNCTRVTKVVIGKDTTAIGAYAFRECTNLTDVFVIGSVKTIGKSAFYGCTGLTEVVIPEGVKTIGSYAFYNCTGLTDVQIPEGVTGISTYAFANCSNLTDVTLPQSLRIIYEKAFQSCSKLVSVDIPKSVSNIGANAFASCGRMATVIFRGPAVIFGENCFDGVKAMAYYDCSDTTWTSTAKSDAGGSMTWGKLHSGDETGYCTNCGHSPQLIINLIHTSQYSSEKVSVTVFADGEVITTANGSTKSTATATTYDPGKTYTFQWSNPGSLLSSVVVILGDEILVSKTGKTLQNGEIFYTLEPYCTHKYDTVVTPPTCTEKGFTTYTCRYCRHSYQTNVVSATGHSFVEGVCTACGETQTAYSGTCGSKLQWRLDVMGTLYISGSGSMYDYVVDSYEDGSKAPWHSYRLQITKVVMEEGVTSAGECAFYGCRNLTEVTIPESMIRLCKQSFYDCTSLTEITIPKGVRYMENAIFRHCTNLTKVTICEGVTTIGQIMFYDCTGLQEITIPSTVTEIGEYAFGNCTNLTTVTFCGSAPTMDSLSFKDTTATVYYPCNGETWTPDVKQAYSGMLTWKANHSYEEGTCTICGKDQTSILPGDLDGDGDRTIVDVARLYAHVQGSNPLDDATLLYADVNGDDTVDIGDTARLYAHVKGTNPLPTA